MLFNSIHFAIFFPIVVLLYFAIPQKFRNVWLLLVSYFYYICWNPKYALLLIASTLITYISGFIIGNEQLSDFKRKLCVGITFFLNISMLFFFKYFNFILDTMESIAGSLHISYTAPALDILLPVGISFYIFQSLTYPMDLYRGQVKAERNLLKYGLFVSFFPQLLAGPIERSKNLLKQFDEVHTFDYSRIRQGLIQMLWGFFLKLVLAERLSIVTNLIYGNFADCTGYQMVLGTFAYAFQIYCDFASYSYIALGAARILGFRLTDNFRQPFFATSCGDLWRRWHISLNTWFREYLYIPLGGGRVSKGRKYLNIMIVFLTSGLWHGANWTYIFWGALSGLFQILGAELAPLRAVIMKITHTKKGGWFHRCVQIFSTFLLFNFSLVFFRSATITDAFQIMKKIFTDFRPESILTTSFFELGLGSQNFLFLLFALLILLFVDICREKYDILEKFTSAGVFIRWGFYFLLVTMILLSANLGSAEFIYFQF